MGIHLNCHASLLHHGIQLFLVALGIPGNLYVLYLYLTLGQDDEASPPSHFKASSADGKQMMAPLCEYCFLSISGVCLQSQPTPKQTATATIRQKE